MFDTVCTIKTKSEEVFTQAIHPSEPLLTIGLASGHVESYRLPGPASSFVGSEGGSVAGEDGLAVVHKAWRTRRHVGSCRSLAYSSDGRTVFSAGSEGVLKGGDSITGKLLSKIELPLVRSLPDAPVLVKVASPQILLVATDSSALHLYDLRARNKPSEKAQQTHHPHADYVSSLTGLPSSHAPADGNADSGAPSGLAKQWVSTGGTTLAVTDLRAGVIAQSEDQGEELLSSAYVGGIARRNGRAAAKVVVGGGDGVLTLWRRGAWTDQEDRVVVDAAPAGGESIDALAALPTGVAGGGHLAVGLGNGAVRFVRLGVNQVVGEVVNDYDEGISGIGFDVAGRMITSGGSVVKIWHPKLDASDDDDDDDAGEGSDDEEEEKPNGTSKRARTASDEDYTADQKDGSADSEDSDDAPKLKRTKKGRGGRKSLASQADNKPLVDGID